MPRKTTKKTNETQTTVLTKEMAIESIITETNQEKDYDKFLYPLTTNDIFLEVLCGTTKKGEVWEIFNLLFSGIRIKINFIKCKDGATRLMLPSVKGRNGYVNLASVPKELGELLTAIYLEDFGEE